MSGLLDISKYGPAAIVTGASSGIGRSFARLLAEAGFDLLLPARRIDRLKELAAELESAYGVSVVPLEADLNSIDAVDTIFDAAAGMDVGLLINNAGFRDAGPHQALDPARLASMIDVNDKLPVLLTHRMIPRLLARGKGGLLFTGSIEANMGFPLASVYAASKAFIRSFGEGLWGELQGRNIDVLVIEPGSTNTENYIRQGLDPNESDAVWHPDDVARTGLENLANGPILPVGDAAERKMILDMVKMPRREALKLMAGG
ncbi:MAG TPA: SDR family NAD(P)-dependent oxidoreductase [Spongiibacteraceae bacterium]|jgi:short-subunit dehydrogenase|nr:SDR family NAD(P)-dependent oxidoreductase [Spongiibacteraceae bacterium]HUH36567.1 SDR family NAD(P)-dependent oxidoreductase [Spongiibacteraceae bacterium]